MSNSLLSHGDKPVAFLSVSNRIRAKDFYAGKLGLKVLYEGEFALVLDLNVTTLRISELKTFQPQIHCAWMGSDGHCLVCKNIDVDEH